MLEGLRSRGVSTKVEQITVDKLNEIARNLRDTLARLQAIEDKLDALDEKLADLDRIELLRGTYD